MKANLQEIYDLLNFFISDYEIKMIDDLDDKISRLYLSLEDNQIIMNIVDSSNEVIYKVVYTDGDRTSLIDVRKEVTENENLLDLASYSETKLRRNSKTSLNKPTYETLREFYRELLELIKVRLEEEV